MSEEAQIAAFGAALRVAFTEFKQEEEKIRASFAGGGVGSAGTIPADIEPMLERQTRRFLIDHLLRGLGWNPGNPAEVIEEARSESKGGDRLHFDYLGLDQGRAPTLLVEAKGSDASAIRLPHESAGSGRAMAALISEALEVVKSGEAREVLAEWAEWLDDLRIYVVSLGAAVRTTLRRVVITSGRWLIVFEDPAAAFVEPGAPDQSKIHCYSSPDEIVEKHKDIYLHLARIRLVNTLSLTMSLDEALQVLRARPKTIESVGTR